MGGRGQREYSRHVGQNQNLNLCNWSPRKRGNENEKEATLQLKGRDHQTGQKSDTQPHLPVADDAEAEVKTGKVHARTEGGQEEAEVNALTHSEPMSMGIRM